MRLRLFVLLVLLQAVAFANADIKPRQDPEEREGKKPANVVIDRVVSFPETNQTDIILLRNMGGQTADLNGWWLSDSRGNKNDPEAAYFFGSREDCGAFAGIPPAGVLELTPFTNDNPCGFPFGVSIKDEIKLHNASDALVGYAAWNWSLQGLVMRRMPNKTYKRLQENKKLPEVVDDHDDLSIFKEALQVTGLVDNLWNSDAEDGGPKVLPFKSSNDAIPFQLPFRFDVKVGIKNLPKRHKPLEMDGVPEEGPFTLFAPTDDAFEEFLEETTIGWKGMSRYDLFKTPQFKEIMLTHILPGKWMTGFMLDGYKMQNAAGAELIPAKDGKKTEGKIVLELPCSDVQPPGEFSCKEQKAFDKCDRSYIKGEGYCRRTCGQCSGKSFFISKIIHADIYAMNGILHKVNRVIAPTKVDKEMTAGRIKAEILGDQEPDSEDDDDDDDEEVEAALAVDEEDEEDEEKGAVKPRPVSVRGGDDEDEDDEEDDQDEDELEPEEADEDDKEEEEDSPKAARVSIKPLKRDNEDEDEEDDTGDDDDYEPEPDEDDDDEEEEDPGSPKAVRVSVKPLKRDDEEDQDGDDEDDADDDYEPDPDEEEAAAEEDSPKAVRVSVKPQNGDVEDEDARDDEDDRDDEDYDLEPQDEEEDEDDDDPTSPGPSIQSKKEAEEEEEEEEEDDTDDDYELEPDEDEDEEDSPKAVRVSVKPLKEKEEQGEEEEEDEEDDYEYVDLTAVPQSPSKASNDEEKDEEENEEGGDGSKPRITVRSFVNKQRG